ncbi:MAG: acyltransferase [Bacteroidota bacterium]|nr:acyltransferase [Bacteroidota bacterium]
MKLSPLNNLQVLRGISALLVCCYHLRPTLKGELNGPLLFGYGYIGVSIFFVISGFIISYSTRDVIINLRAYVLDYSIKRFIRVIPLYYFYTCVWLLVSHQLLMYLSTGSSDLMRVLLFIPLPGKPPPLYVGWTLNYEIYFYIIFGVSFFFKEKRHLFILIYFLSSLILLPLILHFMGFEGFRVKDYPGLFYKESPYLSLITNPFLLLFVFGILISRYYDKIRINKKMTLIVFFTSLIYFIVVYFSQLNNFILEFSACGLLVFSTLLLDKVFIDFKPKKVFTYLGDISYSLYLVHPIIIIYIPNVFKKLHLDFLNEGSTKFFVLLIVSVIAGILSFEVLEKRVLFAVKNLFIKKRKS